jgi:hypothetical protein
MESILPILIGLAILILQAVASSNKKKEEARRRAATPSRPQPYIPSPQPERTSDPFEEWIKSLTSPQTVEEEVETVEETDTEEEEEKEAYQNIERTLYSQDSRPSIEMQMAVPTIRPVPEQQPQDEPATNSATAEPAWHTDTFDLKTAVIYSEILQRKY